MFWDDPIGCSVSPWNPFPTLHPSLQVTYRFPKEEEAELTHLLWWYCERGTPEETNLPVGLKRNCRVLKGIFGWALPDDDVLAFLRVCTGDTLHGLFWLHPGVQVSWVQGVDGLKSPLKHTGNSLVGLNSFLRGRSLACIGLWVLLSTWLHPAAVCSVRFLSRGVEIVESLTVSIILWPELHWHTFLFP